MIFHVTCLNISPKMLPPCGQKCISGFGSRASATTGTCHNYPRSPLRIRLTDNRPNSNIQTKVYHADKTIKNDQKLSDVVRSKSQREPAREHTQTST